MTHVNFVSVIKAYQLHFDINILRSNVEENEFIHINRSALFGFRDFYMQSSLVTVAMLSCFVLIWER